MITEHKSFTTIELFKQLFEYDCYVDNWHETYPDDIDNWIMQMELTEFGTPDQTYRIWTKMVEIDYDEFIVNGFIQKI